MTWAAVAVGVGSAVAGAVGSKAAADAQARGGRTANQLQRESRNMAYTAYEPNRYLGYQAGADLSSLFGWGTPGYTPLNQLLSGNTTGVYNAGGSSGGGSNVPGMVGGIDMLGINGTLHPGGSLMGDSNAPYHASINANTGTVDVKGGHNALDQKMTDYLRTGQNAPTGGHGRYRGIKNAIEQLRAQGYNYTAGQNGQAGSGSFQGSIPATAPGAPSMAKFFTSPGYQFRLDQGQKNIGNSFAARGGAASGNALRSLTAFNQGLASNEYNNYVNTLFRAMGYGSDATQGTVQAGQTYANNAGNIAQNNADSRASGIMGGLNSLGSAANSYLNYNLMNKYLQGQSGSSPAYSPYGPYSGGYQFPG